jgi:signal peptidase II
MSEEKKFVSKRHWFLLAGVVLGGVALDQFAKYLANAYLRTRGLVPLIDGFFELHYARNPGAFFSLGAHLSPDVRRVTFVLASAAATFLIVRLYARSRPDQRVLRFALLFLLAGALGNLVDRVLYGEVVDFAHLYWSGVFDWATFNVADVLITVGLVALGIDLLRSPREKKGEEAATTPVPSRSDPPAASSP